MTHFNRRSARIGLSTATITGLAEADSAVAAAEATGAQTVTSQLRELTSRFVEAAKLIDPSITGASVCSPVDGEHAGAVDWIQLKRAKEVV